MRTTLELSNHLIKELMSVEKWDSKTQAIQTDVSTSISAGMKLQLPHFG